jgi:DNA invertase Pin-like site-specific DNA recombinase
MGRMVLTVLGMVAEMEHGFIKDRQMAGIEAPPRRRASSPPGARKREVTASAA